MWKCKKCGGKVLLVVIDVEKTRYTMDKDFKKSKFASSCSRQRQIFECNKCEYIAQSEEELKQLAEWIEEK